VISNQGFNSSCYLYPETILISQQQNTHLLDLHAASIKYVSHRPQNAVNPLLTYRFNTQVEAIGPDAAHRLNRLPDDNTRK